ncbi:MAG TPA: serpin family protein [Trebonia sp.]|jgi:serine protease inhibitor|nr:serpin family protein [Trebonia sp.]
MRKTLALAVASAAVASAAVAGCSGTAASTGPGAGHVTGVLRGTASAEPAASPRPFGSADTAFGLDVLRAWCAGEPDANLVFSPSTLSSALGLAYLGARGTTATAMARVLHLPVTEPGALAAGLRSRTRALAGASGPGVTLSASDQVWADPSLPPLRGYLNAVATAYDAGLNQVPLRTDPGQAAQRINAAVSAATRGHIPQLVSPAMLDGTGWVLTSALYMDAKWATPFNPSRTRPGTFTTAAGQPVSASFMNGGSFADGFADGWTAVSLPYAGGKLAMTALLPPAGSAACALPATSTLGTLTADVARSRVGYGLRATVALPKVNLSVSADMDGVLTQLGMGVAFRPGQANLSGLSPDAGDIAFVRQAATFQVGEQGTVASAAVAIGVAPTAVSIAPRAITFNRPYLMLVTDTATGEPLFLARVANPAA